MKYYIYSNYPTKKITIHLAQCPFCADGNGLQRNIKSNENGKWYGPFNTNEQAMDRGKKIKTELLPKKYILRNCKRCIK